MEEGTSVKSERKFYYGYLEYSFLYTNWSNIKSEGITGHLGSINKTKQKHRLNWPCFDFIR